MMPKFPIQIIYASTSGHTEAVVDRVAKAWRKKGIKVALHRAEQVSMDVVKNNQLFVLASSTWNHGQINPFFKKFLKELTEVKLSPADKKTAIIGLGDSRYEPVYVCESAVKLEKAWLAQGGKVVGKVLKIEGDPFTVLDTKVRAWAVKTLPAFEKNNAKT